MPVEITPEDQAAARHMRNTIYSHPSSKAHRAVEAAERRGAETIESFKWCGRMKEAFFDDVTSIRGVCRVSLRWPASQFRAH